ncbi:MAG: hypothetical protein IT318_24830 [Anaerolineales bacterium]|nr:hypothetical protein [Anaerolineales bacterium]
MNQPRSGYPRAPLTAPARRPPSPEARLFASVILWFIVLLVLATAAGIWYKLFWLGWVLGGAA